MSHGRHIVVTGGGTGIGRAIALRLAKEGATLTLMARNGDRLQAVAQEARDQGAGAVGIQTCDITDPAQVERAFAKAHHKWGPLYGLVANSGLGGANQPGENDRFDTLVATNLTGTYHCLRAAQRYLAPGPAPRHLVVVASILARIGVAGYTGYCASKAGLLGLVRALAMELAPEGVQVNAVCPGWVDTDMAWEGIDGMAEGLGISRDEAYRRAMRDVPLGRMSRPEEVAGLIHYLLLEDAVGITGQALDINGGAFMI